MRGLELKQKKEKTLNFDLPTLESNGRQSRVVCATLDALNMRQ